MVVVVYIYMFLCVYKVSSIYTYIFKERCTQFAKSPLPHFPPRLSINHVPRRFSPPTVMQEVVATSSLPLTLVNRRLWRARIDLWTLHFARAKASSLTVTPLLEFIHARDRIYNSPLGAQRLFILYTRAPQIIEYNWYRIIWATWLMGSR